jgi:hypothetical protein
MFVRGFSDFELATTVMLTNGPTFMSSLTQFSSHLRLTFVEPLELIGQTLTPNGIDMKLTRRANEYIILANGKSLMSSRMHGSEEALATLAVQWQWSLPPRQEPRKASPRCRPGIR